MTARRTWKRRESEVAEFFHGQRNPLSGSASRHTFGDVIHEKLYIEVKYRTKHAVISLWDKAKARAEIEGKTPLVCLCEKGRPGFWILCHSDDFIKI